jgi:hypothetical protein
MSSKQAQEVKRRLKVRPKAIPLLTKEQFNAVVTDMERKPSKEDLQRIQRAKEILKHF